MSDAVKRGGRWAAVPGRALRDGAMTPKLREVLLSVCYYAHQDGRCVVKISTLAAPTGTDERNMRRYLTQLRDLGYLEITERSTGGLRRASAYRVLHDADLPQARDRAMTEETIMVDTDAVVLADDEQVDTSDRPGTDYPGGEGSQYPVSPGSDYPDPPGSDYPGNNTNNRTQKKTPTSRKLDTVKLDAVQRVFDAWVQVTERTGRTRLDTKRRRLIEARLAEDFTADELLDAVEGWRHSPHHRGENDTGTVYNDLGLLLRNAEHVERFRDFTMRERGELPGGVVTPIRGKGAAAPSRHQARVEQLGDELAGAGETVEWS